MSLNSIYSPKQLEVLKVCKNTDWFMLINHGAKRSGKTIIDNDLFLMELMRVRRIADDLGIDTPQYILAGYSLSNIQDNILTELSNKYGFEFKFDRYNNFTLFGVKVVQTSHGSISGLGRIRGMTAFGAYINEASLSNVEVFDEIKARCSGKGARIICDTNPDHPEHWLLKDYILARASGILSFHFALDDNTFLDKRYVREIKETTPKGVFYDRGIKGLWVAAEGVIYDMFLRDRHVRSLAYIVRQLVGGAYYVSVDYGTQNATVFLLWAKGDEGKWYCIREYYYSGRARQKQKTDAEYVQDMENFVGDTPIRAIIIDPSAASFITALSNAGFTVLKAKNDVLDGIRIVATLLNTEMIIFAEACKETVREFSIYAWDSRAAAGGADVPIKQNDHCMDAVRYFCYTILGKRKAKVKDKKAKGIN